ncbi:transglycosylase domain-containing protein [Alteribacter aurantiacus]|uniref:transglycosylase domain-containing protein n=1 Tax=Alteribacter aurantiacus TaxID=254410 RepID=UPI00040816B3|nr:PBP1A family penicillin-binding protein [Alteribacter aurantiacus]
MSEEYRSRQERKQAMQQTSKNKKKSGGSGGGGKSRFKKILTALLIVFIVMVTAGAITVVAMVAGAPPLDEERLIMNNNPEIYDIDGELVTTLSGSENRRMANIDDVPDVMKDAIIAVEDVRFYDHFGIDMRRLGGAVVANIRGGFGAEGASTITQQVVKNLYLDFDKRLSRKIQEQYLAVRMEQKYTKDQILEMYLNVIYLSDGRYGVVEAADYYFSKELSDLSIADAALLAGLPQRPNAYNPFSNPELAEQRRNIVINQMERYGKITAEEADEARNTPVEDQLNQSERDPYPYQAYLDRVLTEVENIDGIDSNDIYSSGMKIYTNLDTSAQEHVEQVMQTNEYINWPDDEMKAGMTLMDTTTGQITALGGIRQQTTERRTYNWATQPRRQPGSTIKPILDYGPAIEHLKWSTYEQIKDEEYKYKTIDQTIRNAGRGYFGDVSMRYALAQSLNVPALKAFHEVGDQKAKEFGESLGMPLDNMGETYALGGFTDGISSLQLAGAYAAFGNEGEFNRPHTVQKVEFANGHSIDLAPESKKVMEDYTAFMISDMLKTAVTNGTGSQAAISGLPVAGKTGSTNFTDEDRQNHNIPDGIGAVRDSWFAGYTTKYTAAVWTGYNSPSEGVVNSNDGSNLIARQMFKEVMSYVHDGEDTADFEQPDSVVRVPIERGTGLLPSDFTPSDQIINEYFVKGTEPSSVSEEYEIDSDDLPVPSVNAEYNEAEHTIDVSWSFDADVESNFNFELEVRGPGGDYETMDITSDTSYRLSNPEYGETYSIRVTAISDEDEDLRSEPGTVEVTIPEEEEEEPEEEDGILDDIFGDEDEAEEGNEEEQDGSEEEEPSNDEGSDEEDGSDQGNGSDNGNGPGEDNGPPDNSDNNENNGNNDNNEQEESPEEPEESEDNDSGDPDDTEQDPEQ